MSNWEITKLILEYTFWISIVGFFFLALIVRVVIDYFTFFSSWFRSETESDSIREYVLEAISYKGEFKERVMSKALIKMAREIDLLREKTK